MSWLTRLHRRPTPAPPAGPRILVVDDEREVLHVLAEYLRERYAVDTAESGGAALAIARARRPDLVILDLCMPGMDGVETLRRLHALDRTLAVLVLSGAQDVAMIAAALRGGALGYLPKPVDPAYLDHFLSTTVDAAVVV